MKRLCYVWMYCIDELRRCRYMELQDTPPEKKRRTHNSEWFQYGENNNGDNDSSDQNPDGTNGNTPDGNNENREPASEPSIEPEIPSYIGGYNVNPCTTKFNPAVMESDKLPVIFNWLTNMVKPFDCRTFVKYGCIGYNCIFGKSQFRQHRWQRCMSI